MEEIDRKGKNMQASTPQGTLSSMPDKGKLTRTQEGGSNPAAVPPPRTVCPERRT